MSNCPLLGRNSRETNMKVLENQVLFPTLPLYGCVALGKSLGVEVVSGVRLDDLQGPSKL